MIGGSPPLPPRNLAAGRSGVAGGVLFCSVAVLPVFRLATRLGDLNDENEFLLDLINDCVCESLQHYEPMIVVIGRK